jgi:hypothetical protein
VEGIAVGVVEPFVVVNFVMMFKDVVKIGFIRICGHFRYCFGEAVLRRIVEGRPLTTLFSVILGQLPQICGINLEMVRRK